MIASSAPLETVLIELALLIERQTSGAAVMLVLLERDGLRVRLGAAASLAAEYVAELAGFEVARSLNLEVIAEGVERAQQVEFLLAQGCHFAQGHYYSTALPAADITRLLSEAPAARAARSFTAAHRGG